jgi:hypothetical protein
MATKHSIAPPMIRSTKELFPVKRRRFGLEVFGTLFVVRWLLPLIVSGRFPSRTGLGFRFIIGEGGSGKGCAL